MDRLVLDEMKANLEQMQATKDFDIVKWNKEYDNTANVILTRIKNSAATDNDKFDRISKEIKKSLRQQLEKMEIYFQFHQILTTTKTLESVAIQRMLIKYIKSYLELYELRKIRENDEETTFKKYSDAVKYYNSVSSHENRDRLRDIMQHITDIQNKPDVINDRIKQILIPIGIILESDDEDDIEFLSLLVGAFSGR